MQIDTLYRLRDKKEGIFFKVHRRLTMYSLTRMAHDGNLTLIRFQEGDKEKP
jgi:hypothetical protein